MIEPCPIGESDAIAARPWLKQSMGLGIGSFDPHRPNGHYYLDLKDRQAQRVAIMLLTLARTEALVRLVGAIDLIVFVVVEVCDDAEVKVDGRIRVVAKEEIYDLRNLLRQQ